MCIIAAVAHQTLLSRDHTLRQPHTGRKGIAIAVMLVAPVFFASNMIFGRATIPAVAPFTLAFVRWLLVGLILSPALSRQWPAARALVRRHWPRLLLSGFLGGRVDTTIMTIVDVTLSFPQLLLALAFVAALGPSLVTIIVVLGLTGWERYTRVVRAEVLALREKEFVEAARAMGVRPTRIILRHLLPNTFSSIIVMSTLQVAQAILQEAALSFLGVGIPPATPTWGNIMAEGRTLFRVFPHNILFPGVFLAVTVLAVNMLGDGLRDTLDPRTRKQL